MAIVDARDLLKEAAAAEYQVPVLAAAGIADAVAILPAAEEAGCPVMLSIGASGFAPLALEVAMPAVEAAAAQSSAPVALLFDGVRDEAELVRAVRVGAGVVTAEDDAVAGRLVAMAGRCGVPVIRNDDPAVAFLGGAAAAAGLRTLSAAGSAEAVLRAVRRSRPVEHVVMFNAGGLSAPEIDELFRVGCEKLASVPGVRDVRVGRAITDGARYRLCWLVRFANEAVAATYKTDPVHVDFADNRFRPVAADRLTIDFLLL